MNITDVPITAGASIAEKRGDTNYPIFQEGIVKKGEKTAPIGNGQSSKRGKKKDVGSGEQKIKEAEKPIAYAQGRLAEQKTAFEGSRRLCAPETRNPNLVKHKGRKVKKRQLRLPQHISSKRPRGSGRAVAIQGWDLVEINRYGLTGLYKRKKRGRKKYAGHKQKKTTKTTTNEIEQIRQTPKGEKRLEDKSFDERHWS